jgi:hypothetical protein
VAIVNPSLHAAVLIKPRVNKAVNSILMISSFLIEDAWLTNTVRRLD